MSRADAALGALRAELERRRAIIDQADDLVEIVVRVKFKEGTAWVRGVVWEEERVMRASRREIAAADKAW